jgi:hypothetical protein
MGIESMFGGEKYSKAAYKDAEKEADDVNPKFIEFRDKSRIEREGGVHLNKWEREGNSKTDKFLMEKAIRATQRVHELFGKGETEATALNEEYDRLLAQAKQAVKALEYFEKDKLGMSEEAES